MKRHNLLMALVVLLTAALPLSLVSCDKEDDTQKQENKTNPDPEKPDNNPENPDNNPENPDNKPENPTAETPTYTIIYYGHGGGDLDISILENISHIMNANQDSYKKVRASVLYKMSSKESLTVLADKYQFTEEEFDVEKLAHKTLRFVVDSAKDFEEMLDQLPDDIVLDDADFDISSADKLSEYIRWAAQQCPADKYILVLSDHGGGYSPKDDLPLDVPSLSKGLVYNDGNDYDHLTIQKLTKAISESGIRPEVIYLDACLMNTVEYQFELKSLTNYLLLSTFTVPGPGGDYRSLVNELANNANIEDALSKFCKATVKRWDEITDEETGDITYPYSDISAIRTSSLDAFGAQWKEFTDRLIAAYQNGGTTKETIDEVTADMYAITLGSPLYDMIYFAKKIMEALPDHFDEQFAKDLVNAYNATIVCSKASSGLEKHGFQINTSILFGCNNHYTSHTWEESTEEEDGEEISIYEYTGYVTYEADGRMLYYDEEGNQYDQMEWGSTFDNTYKQLKFDQLTNWSEWIEINEQEAGDESPAEFQYEIIDGGFDMGEDEEDE